MDTFMRDHVLHYLLGRFTGIKPEETAQLLDPLIAVAGDLGFTTDDVVFEDEFRAGGFKHGSNHCWIQPPNEHSGWELHVYIETAPLGTGCS